MLKQRSAFVIVCILLASMVAPVSVFSYDDPEYDPIIYKGSFFVLMEPAGPLEPDVYDEDKAIRQLLDEAQYVFSAILYGMSFEYVPKDNVRAVEEEFSAELLHSIPWGDPGLYTSAGLYKNGRYDAEISYKVSDELLPWVISWDTNILPEISAIGMGNLYSGLDGKKEAINNSVKEALRNYLRPRIYDKPRKISGIARLASVPYITMDSGKYVCKARVTLRFEEILEYKVY